MKKIKDLQSCLFVFFFFCRCTPAKTENVPRHFAPAAVTAAVAAWRTGQDVRAVLSDLGYASEVVQGLYEYVNSRFFNPSQPELAGASQEEEMAPRVKRTRTEGKVAPSVKKYVKRCIVRNTEKKFRTDTSIGGTPTSTGTVYNVPLYAITQGAGDNERVGNVISLDKLVWKGYITDGATTPYSAQGAIRCIFVYDKQTNGAAPAVTDILASASYLAPYNHNLVVGAGGARFNILADRTMMVPIVDPAITSYTAKKMTFSLKGKETRFKSAGGTIADVATGGIFLLLIGASNSVQASGTTDLEFHDA